MSQLTSCLGRARLSRADLQSAQPRSVLAGPATTPAPEVRNHAIDLRPLRYLLAVIEQGQFGRAAQSPSIRKQGVSHGISDLTPDFSTTGR